MGNFDKYYYDENGLMTAYEDKTGKLVNITRDLGSIILEEDVTGKTATITLDENRG